MSYIAKTSEGSPFAQTIANNDNISFTTGRFDTVTETWLDNDHNNNGHSFTGTGYIFGTLIPSSNTALCWVLSSSTNDQHTGGEYQHYPNSSRSVSDDEAISYNSNTERYKLSGFNESNIASGSRINVIRIE